MRRDLSRYARAVAATATGPHPPPPPRGGSLRRLYDRFEHLIHELGKFGTVGAFAYVIDLALFNIFLSVMWWLPATVISTAIAATGAFVGNRFWTWRHRARSGLHREYGLYFFFNAVGLGIAVACVWFSHEVLGQMWPEVFQTRLADNVAKMIVGAALGTAFRFWSYRRFVFIEVAQPPVAAGATQGD